MKDEQDSGAPEPTLPIEGPSEGRPPAAAGEDRDAPFLVVVQGKNPGQRFVLTRERTTIGRARECDLVLDTPVVSAEHARIVRTGEGHSIEDLGSTNGVVINGRRLQGDELQPLGHGDALTISDHVLLFFDRGSFSDARGLSTIHVDQERARKDAEALLAELNLPRRRSADGRGA